jgi:hypothetical protein
VLISSKWANNLSNLWKTFFIWVIFFRPKYYYSGEKKLSIAYNWTGSLPSSGKPQSHHVKAINVNTCHAYHSMSRNLNFELDIGLIYYDRDFNINAPNLQKLSAVQCLFRTTRFSSLISHDRKCLFHTLVL